MQALFASQFPSRADCNPYIRLLKGSLAQNDVQDHEHALFLEGRGYPYPTLDKDWLLRHQGRVNLLHFHWLQKYYKAPTPAESEAKIEQLDDFLRLAHSLDYRIAYTFHNIVPHEGMGPEIDFAVRRLIISHADVITCFSHRQRLALQKLFGPLPLTVIPHASYSGYYPDKLSAAECRAKLGLPQNAKVLSFIGLVRPYKELTRLIEEFPRTDPPECYLLLAGTSLDADFGRQVESACRGRARTVCHFRWIADEEIQLFMKAADAVVLPYRKCWTSGAIMLAFTFGRPVITADPMMLDHTAGLGFFYQSPEALGPAMLEAVTSDDLPQMSRNCLDFAARHPWKEAGKRLAQAYRKAAGLSPKAAPDAYARSAK